MSASVFPGQQVLVPFTGRRASSNSKLIAVERHAIVGQRMEYQTLIQDALDAAGAALLYLARDDETPASRGFVSEAARLIREQRTVLMNLLAMVRAEAGVLDGRCEVAEPDHGVAA